ncbi:hypothetical protein BDA96_03G189800 [Sorghum bicolor]|uniref:Uncharacterized protein n=2 Tax=Sorghum bicolor TaxID=4558 RepID=A0A921RDA6_SORBI|nr:hypothetical protein BDA96_03G189800 [Sorghum bicolor]OQU86941.1 hypothetical protein SORBI_3003G175350 [Sorghum bicolor]
MPYRCSPHTISEPGLPPHTRPPCRQRGHFSNQQQRWRLRRTPTTSLVTPRSRPLPPRYARRPAPPPPYLLWIQRGHHFGEPQCLRLGALPRLRHRDSSRSHGMGIVENGDK